MATVLLLGLDDSSAEILARLTIQAGHVPRREPLRTTWETGPTQDIVLISGDQQSYRELLDNIRRFNAAPPVIVISRLGETAGWIDALEAGAADFLAAPYTLPQVYSAIQTAMERPRAFAA